MKDRIESLAIARILTSARPIAATDIAKQLHRFAPTTASEASWRDLVVPIVDDVRDRANATELARRIGKYTAKTWQQFVERVFPALALGVAPDDTKAHAKLNSRDAWTAAIAARGLGLWSEGPPPSLAAVCDAYAWRQLGLAGKPKRCPPEVRALFFQRELATDPGAPDRLVRLFAARQLGAPRPELRALRDALVRTWLEGRTLGANDFAGEVRDVARAARDGVFGDRKVFISSVWDELRRHPTWSSLTLDEFKSRLVRAHRAGDVVLARADLVGALDPALVAASETPTDGTSFHFIVREDRP